MRNRMSEAKWHAHFMKISALLAGNPMKDASPARIRSRAMNQMYHKFHNTPKTSAKTKTDIISIARKTALLDPNPEMRISAIGVLRFAGPKANSRILREIFRKDPSFEVKEAALKSIIQRGTIEKSLEHSNTMLKFVIADPKNPEYYRIQAIDELGRRKDTSAVPLLKHVIAEYNGLLSDRALRALHYIQK